MSFLLLNSFNEFCHENKEILLVIAGSGQTDYVDKIKKIVENFWKLNSINLLKTNYEIVRIIKKPLMIGISCAELLGTENFLNVFKKKLKTKF